MADLDVYRATVVIYEAKKTDAQAPGLSRQVAHVLCEDRHVPENHLIDTDEEFLFRAAVPAVGLPAEEYTAHMDSLEYCTGFQRKIYWQQCSSRKLSGAVATWVTSNYEVERVFDLSIRRKCINAKAANAGLGSTSLIAQHMSKSLQLAAHECRLRTCGICGALRRHLSQLLVSCLAYSKVFHSMLLFHGEWSCRLAIRLW